MSNSIISNSFICPITLHIFNDPITVTCCGQTYSREALVDHFKIQPTCPMCRSSLVGFNPVTAKTNVVMADLVRNMTHSDAKFIEEKKEECWSATIQKVYDLRGKYVGESLLEVQVENSQTVFKPTLFVMVADKSGSMSGKPWEQVESAILHIIGTTQTSNMDSALILYDSDATVVDIKNVTRANIRQLFTSGGTNFHAAFQKVGQVLRGSDYNKYILIFLTDGDTVEDKNSLVQAFKSVVKDKNVTVHTVGFGVNCNKDFLEELRFTGQDEGVFRYADHHDNADVLSQKITCIFDESARYFEMDVLINGIPKKISVGSDKKGKYQEWITTEIPDVLRIRNNNIEHTVKIISRSDPLFEDKKSAQEILEKWFQHRLDILATNVLQVEDNVTDISVLLQQIQTLEILKTHPSLSFLKSQLQAKAEKRLIDVGRLRDLRFASRFQSKSEKAHAGDKGRDLDTVIRSKNTMPMLDSVGYNEYSLHRYSRNNQGLIRNRDALQQKIISEYRNREISDIDPEYKFIHRDADGNTVFHLAAYCGQDKTLERLCQVYQQLCLRDKTIPLDLLDSENIYQETPFTIAVKKQGFYRCIHVLLKYGARIPEKRLSALQRFAVSNEYMLTAELLGNLGNIPKKITIQSAQDMSPSYIRFLIQSLSEEKEKSVDDLTLFEVVLSKNMLDLVKIYLPTITPTIDHLLNWCFPKKPDALDTDQYLELAKLLLDQRPELISMANSTGETALFKAVEKGSLPHVKMMIRLNANLEARNDLGNTPLWIACAKKYPCIVEELLLHGADPNAINHKGNPPIYATCQVGPLKIAEMLLTHQANVEYINTSGETLILIACRNGQHQILTLLLQYVDMIFVERKAPVDKFNALFASIEANRPECLKILHNYGVPLDQKTDEDNEILPNATPLHLAAYYNRVEVTEMLLELKVSVDLLGVGGITPLQLATIQNNLEIVKRLIQAGADKSRGLLYAEEGPIKEILTDSLNLSDIKGLANYWHAYLNNIDITDSDGNTLLTQAVLSGDVTQTQLLLSLGADVNKKNKFGLTPITYAKWMRQKRILNLLIQNQEDKKDDLSSDLQLSRLLKACVDGISTRILSLEPWKNISPVTKPENKNRFKIVKGMSDIYDPKPNDKSLVQFVAEFKDREVMWKARFQTVSQIANDTFNLSPLHVFIVELYKMIGFHDPYFELLVLDALQSYPLYENEIFLQLDNPQKEGDIIHIEHVFSGYRLWKLATQNFNPKNGIIAIFKSPIARLVGNTEIVLLPGSYIVQKMYHYDPICLGQKNIRDTAYKIKENDHVKALVLTLQDSVTQ
jgi:ankyrin repeat protein/uncharacterized protein YegL